MDIWQLIEDSKIQMELEQIIPGSTSIKFHRIPPPTTTGDINKFLFEEGLKKILKKLDSDVT